MDRDDPTPLTATGQSLLTSTTMLLVAAGRAAQRNLDAALGKHGVTLRHLGALGHLARDPELSYSDLARRVDVTAQSMHATVATLVDLGAITVHNAERGRAARLRLTKRGHELLRAAAATASGVDDTWTPRGQDPDQLRATLLDAARQLRAADRY